MPTQDFKGTVTGSGGTLTVDETVAMSSKAPKANPVFTGDVTLAGEAVNATLPAFLAYNSAEDTNATGDGTAFDVIFDAEVYDQANNFNGVSLFTAPVTGRYNFSGAIQIYGLGSAHYVQYLTLVTSNRSYLSARDEFVSNLNVFTNRIIPFSFDCDMDVGDTAKIQIMVSGGTKVVSVGATAGCTYFGGHLIC